MSNENNTAQTNVEEVSQVGTHAETDANEGVNEAVFQDGNQPEAEHRNTKEENARNARRRREAERKAEIEKAESAAREKAIIETLGGKNPYTYEPMTDSADVEEYLAMREIEKNGGDPLSDFASYQKKKRREKEEEEKKQNEQQKWYKDDYDAFANKYPDVKIEDLLADTHFQKYALGRVGTVPLSEIYEGYSTFVSEYEKRARKQASQLYANAKSTPGSLSGGNSDGKGFFTVDDVKKMSAQEVHEYYDVIRESMKKWK